MKLTFQLICIAVVVYGVYASALPERNKPTTPDTSNDENMTTTTDGVTIDSETTEREITEETATEGVTTDPETTEEKTALSSISNEINTTVSKFDPKDSNNTVFRKVEVNNRPIPLEQDQPLILGFPSRSNFDDPDAEYNENVLPNKLNATNPIQHNLENCNDGRFSIITESPSTSITEDDVDTSNTETDSNTQSDYQGGVSKGASILNGGNMNFKTIVLTTAGILIAARIHKIFQ